MTVEILARLESILTKGLLTPAKLGRNKSHFGLTPNNTVDVWSPLWRGARGDNPKQSLLDMVSDIGTSVTLLLSVSHQETGNYPHSITTKIPSIKGLVLSEKYSSLLFDKDFTSGLLLLSQRFNIPIFDSHGVQVDLLKIEAEYSI